MTQPDTDLKSQPPVIPEHWSVYLRCTICYGYLREPHTLACGHSFCRRCLRRLAEIAKDDNPDVRVRHLSLTCPACRHPFPAKPVLCDRVSTCIVLKQLVELWRRECSLLASSSTMTVRSICTQTSVAGATPTGDQPATTRGSASDVDLCEEFGVRMRPLDQYYQAVMQRVSESTEDLENDTPPETLSVKESETEGPNSIIAAAHLTVALINPLHHQHHHNHHQQQHHNHHHRQPGAGSDTSSDSDVSSHSSSSRRRSGGRGSDNELDANSLSSVSIPDLFGRVTILPQLTDLAPARLLLLFVWCMYSVVIVGLAQSFLPYVILFTLFFFLVVLR